MPHSSFQRGIVAAGLAAALVVLTGCDSDSTDGPQGSPESRLAEAVAAQNPMADPTVIETRNETDIDIGDVEQAFDVVGVVSDLSAAENVEESIIQDRRKRIRAVNIKVSPPNPETLWLKFRVDSTRDFVERPVLLDTKILVDGELLDTFTILLGPDAYKNNFRRDVEVLFGRTEIPASMLITMESEALLLPEGIDWSVTDPYSVDEGDRTRAIYNAPIRIDFTAPGPKGEASEPAAPAEPPVANPS